MKQAVIETVVGIFIILALICLIILAIQVSGLSNYRHQRSYEVTAAFNNIGDLKIRAPVTIGGVRIGQVVNIALDPKTFQAIATFSINKQYNNIPVDSTANIYTAGLLGSNYISLTPGFSDKNLKNGDQIQNSHSALILQNLIGQLLFSLKGDSQTTQSANDKGSQAASSSSHGGTEPKVSIVGSE